MAVEPGPAGWSIVIPNGPAPSFDDYLKTDPFYQGDLETINQQKGWEFEDLARARTRENEAYEMNVNAARASASGGGDYGLAQAREQAALAKEKAAHDDKNFRANMRERLGSRGALDSGQWGWENTEADWQLDMLRRQIETDLKGREAAAASARADANARLQLQLQEMATRHNWALEDIGIDETRGEAKYAGMTGNAAKAAYARGVESGAMMPPTIMAAWDPESGLYKTRDGRYYYGDGTATTWNRPPANTGGGGGGATQGAPYVPPGPLSTQSPGFYQSDNALPVYTSGQNKYF